MDEFEPGRKLLVHYGDGLWHERVILRPATPAAFQSFWEEPSDRPSLPYWIATPDADVYPEDLEVPRLAARRVLSEDELVTGRLVGIGPTVRTNSSHRFVAGRAGGTCSALFFARAVRVADAFEGEGGVADAASGVRGAAQLGIQGPVAE